MAITGFLIEVLELASSSGSVAFHWSLTGVLMISSFTSGLPMRDTCTNGPLVVRIAVLRRASFVLCRAVLAYIPMTGSSPWRPACRRW